MKQATQATASTIRISAELVRPGETGKSEVWDYLTLPKSAKVPSRGVTTVEGTINGFPFGATIETAGKGIHRLKVKKVILDAAGVEAGEAVAVEITRIGDEPEIRVPADLREALEASPRAGAQWAQITPMARRDWILWLSSGKLEETRRNKLKKACSMLGAGKKRVCCFGGLGWLTKDLPKSCETWGPLPGAKK